MYRNDRTKNDGKVRIEHIQHAFIWNLLTYRLDQWELLQLKWTTWRWSICTCTMHLICRHTYASHVHMAYGQHFVQHPSSGERWARFWTHYYGWQLRVYSRYKWPIMPSDQISNVAPCTGDRIRIKVYRSINQTSIASVPLFNNKIYTVPASYTHTNSILYYSCCHSRVWA